MVWQDKRSEMVLAELSGSDAAEIRRRSGLPVDPYFSAGKLAWLLRHDDAVAQSHTRGTLRMGNVDAYLCDRLGGGFVTDASTASRTQLHRLGTGGWDPWLLERFGVPQDVLPRVGDSVGPLGTLRHERWPAELPLTARLCDQQAALAGSGCVVPGAVKATYGTGVFVLAHAGETVPKPGEGLLPTVAWRRGGSDTYALDGGVFAAGAMLEWLCAELGIAETPAQLGELARTVPDARGARVLPALAGLGAPWWEPGARAVLAGIDGGTTGAPRPRSARGIAWRVADIVAEIRRELPVGSLRVDGGLTNEPLLLELQAEAIGVPVEAAGADATVAGVAGLAAAGAGLLGSIQDISPRSCPPSGASARAAPPPTVRPPTRRGGPSCGLPRLCASRHYPAGPCPGNRRNLALVAAAVALAITGFFVLQPSDDSTSSSSPETTTTQASTPPSTTTSTTSQTPTTLPEATVIHLVNGQPVGGKRKISVKRGDTIRLKVTSDEAGEIHVHGFDLEKETAPGAPARFMFKADIEGRFEVESHPSATQIAEISVNP